MSSNGVQVIAVTSGKGGVGKTNTSINIAACLAKQGSKVMLMDADFTTNIGNKYYHRWIMTQCPEIVAEYIECES